MSLQPVLKHDAELCMAVLSKSHLVEATAVENTVSSWTVAGAVVPG